MQSACLAACYVGCRLLVRIGLRKGVVATKETELRTELLGYDVRLDKLGILMT